MIIVKILVLNSFNLNDFKNDVDWKILNQFLSSREEKDITTRILSMLSKRGNRKMEIFTELKMVSQYHDMGNKLLLT